jgi:glycosyltransferase involved in cell wall biosynthesis
MITVIIPIYNAEKFLYKSVNSVLFFTIVSEVILIDDGSSDESYSLISSLKKQDDRIKVFSHDDKANHGPSATRNFGILKTSNSWISFLDADDYFLPNRFENFQQLITNEILFDGVYEPIQYFNGSERVYGINYEIPSNKLFHYLIRGTYGHIHTNGLIVKKDLLIKAGLFNETLELHQDSELWLKLAHYGKLISGSLADPVAMVRVHEGNRIWKGTSNTSRLKQWRITWSWAWSRPVGFINKLLILRKLVIYKIGSLKE